MLDQVLVLINQITGDKLILVRKEDTQNLAILFSTTFNTVNSSQDISHCYTSWCNLDICKVIIKPNNLLIIKPILAVRC